MHRQSRSRTINVEASMACAWGQMVQGCGGGDSGGTSGGADGMPLITARPRWVETVGAGAWLRVLLAWLTRWRVVHRGRLLVRGSSIATAWGSRQSAFWRIAGRAGRRQGGLFGAPEAMARR